MKYADEYRDTALALPLLRELQAVKRPMRIMEICGSHTMAIAKSGLRQVLPEHIELISGPGCPVCVTAQSHIDTMIELARQPRTRLATFGDMFRVPGVHGSLSAAMAEGAKAAVVYSPIEALELARRHADEEIIFFAVGFETTAPGVAATILAAKAAGLNNFSVFSSHKTMPAPLHALLSDPNLALDGLLCPGHVAAIIGASAFQVFCDDYHLACCVAGFELADLLSGLVMLARRISAGEARLDNAYERTVSWLGNERAQRMLVEVFEPVDMLWRGLGMLAGSGLGLRDKYREFDAAVRFSFSVAETKEPAGCRCGDVIRGAIQPPACPLFRRICGPGNPIGPCMVSGEGACAAWFAHAPL
ncbi:MAG: hydrogenase formation protein HypD [Desulfobulbaceae bacterium]|jgi:hydrogenase expression/formation protein HypD|nr:hydrogenase formation protein HypD [Desulfobulbaceae bacterium]